MKVNHTLVTAPGAVISAQPLTHPEALSADEVLFSPCLPPHEAPSRGSHAILEPCCTPLVLCALRYPMLYGTIQVP
jgi:hypothetical protein